MSRVVQLLSQASRLRAAGDLPGAERMLVQATQADPRHAGALHQLGIVQLEQRRAAESVNTLSRAIMLRPDLAPAHMDRGRALAAMARYPEAEAALRTATSIDPRLARAWTELGLIYLAQRRDTTALPLLARALELSPRDPDVQFAMGRAVSGARCPAAALPYFRRSAELTRTPASLAGLGECLLRVSKTQEALNVFEEAARLDPDNLTLRIAHSRAMEALGRRDEALNILAELALAPGAHAGAIAQYALTARGTDHAARAHALVLQTISRMAPASSGLIGLHFALGGFLDDEGDFAGAFRAFQHANSLLPQTFNAAALDAQFDEIIASFPPEQFPGCHRSARDDRTPVFIVGMPRSGTTLLERILGGHPRASGVGELATMILLALSLPGRIRADVSPARAVARSTPEHLTALADEYLSSVRSLAPDSLRIVDKMPHNFMHLGLIALALPGASIIHNRRHPLDTCLSIYTTWLRESHDYAVSLPGIACMYRNYRRLMKHWGTLLGDRIIDCAYEDVVSDVEGSARRIIGAIGLEWNDSCLTFHTRSGAVHTASVSQVRRPIYTSSTNRWKNYEPYLGELIDGLRDAV
ncbi:MAG: sulfotransferase [Phycisphaerales bacterium]|nr:sulfotransferase [Phycisphaerales bacterium]